MEIAISLYDDLGGFVLLVLWRSRQTPRDESILPCTRSGATRSAGVLRHGVPSIARDKADCRSSNCRIKRHSSKVHPRARWRPCSSSTVTDAEDDQGEIRPDADNQKRSRRSSACRVQTLLGRIDSLGSGRAGYS
jgi:hypothetical protein